MRRNLRATIYRDGFSVVPRDPRLETDTGGTWKATFRVESYGSNDKPFPAWAETQTQVLKNQARLAFEDIILEYQNDTNGFEQSFTLTRRPDAGVGPLKLQLTVALQDLEMEMDPTGEHVVFADAATGVEVLRYTGLHVFDANGTELPAQMAMSEGARIVITVDDAGATYPILVDPWVQHPSVIPPSFQAGGAFGFSVAYLERWRPTLGNYEGSLIVGAPYYDSGKVDQGKVFAYGPSGSGSGMTFGSMYFYATGEDAYSNFGYSVAVAQPFDLPDPGLQIGTFQSDSLADLVVGAPGYYNRNGKVYVYYGANAESHFGANDRAADRTYFPALPAGSDFGYSLAAGDVTGDGFQDLLIGSPNSGAGKVYLSVTTSTGLPVSTTMTLNGSTSGEQFGFSLAIAGDVNGDGVVNDGLDIIRRDVIVGAPNYKNGTYTGAGKVYLFNGISTGLDSTAYWSDTVSEAGAKFGYAVAGNADIDGNWPDNKDFVVGAPYYNANATDSGAVFVYRSNSTGNPQPRVLLQTTTGQAGCRFGYAVALGDLNPSETSQFADVIVGAPWYDTNPNDDKGRVFVFWGRLNDSPFPTPDQLESPQDSSYVGEHFGSSLTYIFKISDPADTKCFAAGAPDADLLGANGGGLVGLYEYQPQP